MGTRFSDSEHVFPKFFRSSEFGVSKKRVLSQNTFFRFRTRFSEHVSRKFSEFGVRTNVSEKHVFSEPEHVSPTQNTFLRNFRSSEFGVSEKRVLSGEHVSPTQNTFLRLRTRFSEIFGVRSSEFPKNVFRVRTRFSDSEHVSPNFSEFGVRSFPKTCSEWEHVSPTQNTFLRNFRLRSFGEHVSPTQIFGNFGVRSSEFRKNSVLGGNTFLRLRTRFSDIFGVRSSEFWRNGFRVRNSFLRLRTRFILIFFGVRSSAFRKNMFRVRTRFSDSEHVSPIIRRNSEF